MSDPVCTSARHYFRTPLFDGEKCLCGATQYDSQTAYHHKPHDSDDEPTPYNPLNVITSPWAPLIESALINSGGGGSSFGGGSSGGGGASGGW